jgi:hypothetical protein
MFNDVYQINLVKIYFYTGRNFGAMSNLAPIEQARLAEFMQHHIEGRKVMVHCVIQNHLCGYYITIKK